MSAGRFIASFETRPWTPIVPAKFGGSGQDRTVISSLKRRDSSQLSYEPENGGTPENRTLLWRLRANCIANNACVPWKRKRESNPSGIGHLPTTGFISARRALRFPPRWCLSGESNPSLRLMRAGAVQQQRHGGRPANRTPLTRFGVSSDPRSSPVLILQLSKTLKQNPRSWRGSRRRVLIASTLIRQTPTQTTP